jgi:hypothetical protein
MGDAVESVDKSFTYQLPKANFLKQEKKPTRKMQRMITED